MEQKFEINSKQLNDGSFLNNSFTSLLLLMYPVIRLWIKKVIEPKS